MLNVLRPGPSSSLVVLGAGAVGISAVMAARLVGCGTIIAADPFEQINDAVARMTGGTVIKPVVVLE